MKFTVLGRMTKNVEVIEKDGKKYTHLSIAKNEKVGDKEKTNFYTLTVFGKLAETLEKWTEKGCRVLVSGRVDNNEYEKDGKKISTNSFVVEDLEIVDFAKKETK